MSKDEQGKIFFKEGGIWFKKVVVRAPDHKKLGLDEDIELHLKECKILLCSDCAQTALDEDGEIKERYVECLEAFLAVPPVGRKPERCPVCKSEYDRNYQREYKKEIRKRARKKKAKKEEPFRWSDCPKYEECYSEAARANENLFCQTCQTYLQSHPVHKN